MISYGIKKQTSYFLHLNRELIATKDNKRHKVVYEQIPKLEISRLRLTYLEEKVKQTKIAVVGSGIAGTTCALELHKLGHEVEIFEMAAKDEATRPRQMEGSVYLLHNTPEIKNDHLIRTIKLHSPNVTATLNGKIGCLYEVGGISGVEAKARKNIERLLPIHYSTKIRSKSQLQDKFQIIVAADGYRSVIAKEADLLASKKPRQIGVGIGFTVKGNFDPESIEIWLDNHFSLNGYSYVIPFSKHEASLVSASIGKAVNQAIYRERLEELAELRNWKLHSAWVDFESWYDFSSYAEANLYVIGNAGSFTEPAFGFGLKWSIESAKLCTRAIHENVDFNVLVRRELLPDFESFQIIKKAFEKAEDSDYDKFVKRFRNRLVKKLAESGTSVFQDKWLIKMLFPHVRE
jgi:digeranylgeranylglycerophospholipid reductase